MEATMRHTLRSPLLRMLVVFCLCMTGWLQAQSSGDAATGGNAKANSHTSGSGTTSSELKELKDAIAAQQQQIQQLQQQIQSRDSAIQQLQQQVGQAQSSATQAQSTAQSALGG